MANEYLNLLAAEIGVSVWLLCALVVWSLSWKLVALWKSARQGSLVWFIVLAIFNTVGVLPILYIFVFSRVNPAPITKKKSAKKKVKKKKK